MSKIKAYSLSALVIVGPTILCMVSVFLLQFILSLVGIGFRERELFMAAVTYSFIFSLLLTNGFSLLISRYISDQIFNESYDEILPSFYGVLTICLILGSIVGLIFYAFSPLNLFFKFIAYLLFMELIIVWLISVYISSFKNYMRIVKGFALGFLVTLALAIIFIKVLSMEGVISCLIALSVGVLVIIWNLMVYMRGFLLSSKKNYFRFLIYFDKYPSLFFVGLFYVIGIYVHNFVFWTSPLRVVLKDTYVYCPFYDVPSFYAMITILMGMVIFVVSIETSFYEKYKGYYTAVLGEGTLRDIDRCKTDMYRVLTREIANAMVIQLVISLFFILVGIFFLPKIGFTAALMDVFKLLTIGSYGCIFLFVIMLLMLYFDDRKGALFVATLFMISNLIFTVITLMLGENWYGFGFFVSTMVTLGAGLVRLFVFIKHINYYTFCAQPIYYRAKKRMFTRLVGFLEKAFNTDQD